jgi:acyl dehydratase
VLTLTGRDEVRSYVGKELGVSDWLEVTQETIDRFSDVTGDDQWIHVDVEAAKQTPFGGTIAHGYYVLSLAPRFSYTCSPSRGWASTSTTG